jgi:hypothetical protein
MRKKYWILENSSLACLLIIITTGAQAFLMDYTQGQRIITITRAQCGLVLTTANAAGTNGLTCLPKHGGARDNKILVIHPMSGQRSLTSANTLRTALTAGPSSSSINHVRNKKLYRAIIIIIISAERLPLLDIGLPQSSPRRSVLSCPHPATSRDLHQIVGPPCGGPTNAASPGT